MPSSPAPTLAHLLDRGAPRSPDRDTLQTWGQALGAVLPRPVVVTLAGDLGAGKTTLVKALCAGLGVYDLTAVTSPTFSIVQHYAAPRGPVTHVDLYRLRSDDELAALGWDELVESSPVLLIEWPERAANTLPRDTIALSLSVDAADAARRTLRIQAPMTR